MTDSLNSATPELGPPNVFVRQRWLPQSTVEWVRDAEAILLKHGRVDGQTLLEHRHQARWRANRLIRLMVELRLHERWELSEHTERQPDGWAWSVVQVHDPRSETRYPAMVKYAVIYEQGPTSWGAWVPDLPGCVAAGETRVEVRELITKAIVLHIESLRDHNEPVPEPRSTASSVAIAAADD